MLERYPNICRNCDGLGKIEYESFKRVFGDAYEPYGTWETCEVCNGDGELDQEEE